MGEKLCKKIPSIKILPEYFEEVIAGRKRAELRLNDRNYKKGDIYDLREWNPTRGRYTGRKVNIEITHVLEGFEGLTKGWCMFSFKTYEEIFGKDDEPTCKTLSIDYEAISSLRWNGGEYPKRARGSQECYNRSIGYHHRAKEEDCRVGTEARR